MLDKLHLFDNPEIMNFVENEKLGEGFAGKNQFDYCWNREMKEVKKFIPKYIRRSIKDKHGIVDGASFFVHLFEMRLFLQNMPEEVLFLALKAENKFSKESKYLLVKFILAILGKFVVTPAQIPRGAQPSSLSLNDCIRSGKRLFIFFKPNLLFEDDYRIGFAGYQHEEIHLMNNILAKTFFPVNSCFGQVEKAEKELFYEKSGSGEAPSKKPKTHKSPSKIMIHRMIKNNSKVAIRLMEFVDRVIVSSDRKFWTSAKTLNEWGIWQNKQKLFSKFHNTEDINELMVQTEHQIDKLNTEHRQRFVINNLTLTLSKKKKQFLKNVINLNLPTVRNLFAQLVAKAQLHHFIFKLLRDFRKWEKVINIFKFDFVNKIKIISKLLIFANSTQKVEIVHFFAYEKYQRNFVKIPLDGSGRLFPNGMLFVPDLEKFLSEYKKTFAKKSKEKIKFKKKILVVFKIEERLYLKYYGDQTSLLVRHHKRLGAAQTHFGGLRYSTQIRKVYFEVNEKDQLLDEDPGNAGFIALPKKNLDQPRMSNLFGDNWQMTRGAIGNGRGSIHTIKEERNGNRPRQVTHFKPKIDRKPEMRQSGDINFSKYLQSEGLEGEKEQQFSRRWWDSPGTRTRRRCTSRIRS